MSLEISNLQKTYIQGKEKIQVLKGLNLKLNKGETVAILGQSGSGKSTLLSLLAGLDKPENGEIIINSQNIVTLGEKDLTKFRSQNIGIVFQQYHLISHLDALENVSLPLEIKKDPSAHVRAATMLEELKLSHRMNHKPSELSGGECQRVAIARALVVEPSLLLADEPSGNLDAQTGKKVMDYFFSIVKKHQVTTILVTHNEELAKSCNRVFKLSNGVLEELQ